MTLTLTDQANGSKVHAGVGDTLELHLPENATAGYRWQLEEPDAHQFSLEVAAADYAAGRPGSAGSAVFRIKVLSAGPQTLRLKYGRSWEGEAGVLSRFSVVVLGE